MFRPEILANSAVFELPGLTADAAGQIGRKHWIAWDFLAVGGVEPSVIAEGRLQPHGIRAHVIWFIDGHIRILSSGRMKRDPASLNLFDAHSFCAGGPQEVPTDAGQHRDADALRIVATVREGLQP